jgi:hypothetical protein
MNILSNKVKDVNNKNDDEIIKISINIIDQKKEKIENKKFEKNAFYFSSSLPSFQLKNNIKMNNKKSKVFVDNSNQTNNNTTTIEHNNNKNSINNNSANNNNNDTTKKLKKVSIYTTKHIADTDTKYIGCRIIKVEASKALPKNTVALYSDTKNSAEIIELQKVRRGSSPIRYKNVLKMHLSKPRKPTTTIEKN